MSSASEKEALGDWANLKGTRYHLVYALWLLLCGDASEVVFYAGNDLLAAPIKPPLVPDTARTKVEAIPIVTKVEGKDIWVQLKATDDPWTVTELLGDNLLFNFICNAVSSIRQGRVGQG